MRVAKLARLSRDDDDDEGERWFVFIGIPRSDTNDGCQPSSKTEAHETNVGDR